jgi:hypothetical protein
VHGAAAPATAHATYHAWHIARKLALVGGTRLDCHSEESLSSLLASSLPRCQKPMLRMTNATPIGRKDPILPLTAPTIMKVSPLKEKSVAAVLYDFESLEGLLLILKAISY